MPKRIDSAERDRVIASAAWRVLLRDGLAGFSVRNVADEARLATASLRRRFPTQNALRVFCLRLVADRVQQRLDRVDPSRADDPVAYAVACLEQLLPLDEDRRAEMEVFLMLASMASTDDAIRAAYDDAHAAVALACRSLLAPVIGSPDEDAVVDAARRIHALLDGLSVHLLRQADDADGAWAIEILRGEIGREARGS
ncbi:MAG: putative TetR-family transcriptional regulator [Microbacterium sp.]|jgi:AcrR family transcriptional regulator|nr:putative TetR-family transcriptional regulator [Microbacterium sp.]